MEIEHFLQPVTCADAFPPRPFHLRDWLEPMIAESEHPELSDRFLDDTEAIGWRLVHLLSEFGFCARLLEDDSFAQRAPSTVGGGCYDSRNRTLWVSRSRLTIRYGSTIHHEVAHAIDHMLATLAGSPTWMSTTLWHRFAARRRGFVTDYAATRPNEYFAESFEAYLDPYARETLHQVDPDLFRLLESLLESSRGE